MEQQTNPPVPNLQIPDLNFLVLHPLNDEDHAKNNAALMDLIKENNMAVYYAQHCEQHKKQIDQALLEKMVKQNAAKLAELDEAIKDAELNLGESEIREAFLAKANFYAAIGDKKEAILAFRKTTEKTASSGQKLDIIFTVIRIGFFFKDHDLISRYLDKAKGLIDINGDWDRKNRMKVYEGVYQMMCRNFSKASALLLETISTFTCLELFSYNDFIFYTVLMGVIHLSRPMLKQKVIDSPEVLSVIRDIPDLEDFLNSLHECNYGVFFRSLADIMDRMKRNWLLAPHTQYFCREMRIKAYSQLLQSYKTVQMASMAEAFGVTEEFIDKELSRFIASGRLHCKLDKVSGTVETVRPDAKNALYQQSIKQGDLLLNRIQKLARII